MLVYSLRACILTLAYHACILTLAYFDTGILRTWMLSLVQCVCVCKCKCRSVSVQREEPFAMLSGKNIKFHATLL